MRVHSESANGWNALMVHSFYASQTAEAAFSSCWCSRCQPQLQVHLLYTRYTVLNATSHFMRKNSVRRRFEMLLMTFCCHCSLITKQHSTKTALTEAKMWHGKMPCVSFQLQESYSMCRLCPIGAGVTGLSKAISWANNTNTLRRCLLTILRVNRT